MYLELIEYINECIKNNKNFTIAVDKNGKLYNPKHGYIISITPLIDIGMDTNQIIEYVVSNKYININNINHKLYIGGWFDKDKLNTGISIVSEHKDEAIKIGQHCSQKAIYYLNKKETITINN